LIGEILFGLFGNTIYDLIKGTLKDVFLDKDDDLIQRIYNSLEEASSEFFKYYGNQFGKPSSSFLARQSNVEIIVRSIFYGNKIVLDKELSPKGFDADLDVSKEALDFFVNKLNEVMMKDFRLNKIITEKRHIWDSQANHKEIIELFDNITQHGRLLEKNKDSGFSDWIMQDENGNESKLIESKQYHQIFQNGLEYTYMLKMA
jgi:hypothetical protein